MQFVSLTLEVRVLIFLNDEDGGMLKVENNIILLFFSKII